MVQTKPLHWVGKLCQWAPNIAPCVSQWAHLIPTRWRWGRLSGRADAAIKPTTSGKGRAKQCSQCCHPPVGRLVTQPFQERRKQMKLETFCRSCLHLGSQPISAKLRTQLAPISHAAAADTDTMYRDSSSDMCARVALRMNASENTMSKKIQKNDKPAVLLSHV